MKQREVSERTFAVIDAARENRALRKPSDMMEFVQDGAADIATLTVIARGHQFEFEPAMEALERLAKLADWDHPFLVADRTPGDHASVRFRWQDSPSRRFKNFADFYARELEPAWGPWEDLRRIWKDVGDGRKTIEEATAEVMRNAQRLNTPQEAGSKGGRGKKALDDVKSFSGNNPDYIAARIKAHHPDIERRVLAGEFKSMRAAGIAAGFIHPPTPYQELHRAWKKASEDERRAFLDEVA